MLVVILEILGLFVNTFADDEVYLPQNRENVLQQIQMQLSQKPKIFSQFFIAFLKSTSNSVYFEKKNESQSLCVSEITDSKRGPYLNI